MPTAFEVLGITAQGSATLTDVEIRISRAGDSAGVDPYQEVRWRPKTRTTWTGDFDANDQYKIEHEVLSGIGGARGPVDSNTRDAIALGNDFSRIFTASRPPYQPQLGQAWCGRLGWWQCEHSSRLGTVSA